MLKLAGSAEGAVATLLAFIGMAVLAITTFRYWQQGLLTFGLPDAMSGVVAVVSSAALFVSILMLQANIRGLPKRMVSATRSWPLLLLGLSEVLLLGLLVGFYVLVCERGGRDVFFVP